MLYLRTTIGTVPHITPHLLDQIDPSRKLGLYVTYDAFNHEICTPLHDFLNEKRKILLGPSFIDFPPQLQADGVRIRTNNLFIPFKKADFKAKIAQLEPDFVIAPSPHPRKENYSRSDFYGFDHFDGARWIYESGEYRDITIFSSNLTILEESVAQHKIFYCENNIEHLKRARGLGYDVVTNIFDYYSENSIMLGENFQAYFMKNRVYEKDLRQLDPECRMECCKTSRAYIHHLVECHELTGYIFMQLHNVAALQRFWVEER